MKKILLQLDTDQHPSPFDRIVAHDVGVDEVLSYGGVAASDVQSLVQAAVFTRGPDDLRHTAVWIGGSDATLGERLLAEVQGAFFGPFRVSVMVDSNGCNTTAATAAAKLQERAEWHGRPAVVIGLGPVGRQMSLLLARAGHPVVAATLPSKLLGPRFNAALSQSSLAQLNALAAGLPNLQLVNATDWAALEPSLAEAEIALACGPAGVQLLRKEVWSAYPGLQVLVDFNLAAPAGIEGVRPADDFKERDGRLALGPVGLGNAKMKVHKACVAQMFERNDLVFDAASIYRVAREMVLSAPPA